MNLKWAFGALVLANLGLWMWASWYHQPALDVNRSVRAPIAAEKMRLLSEPGVRLQPRKAPPPAHAELSANAPQVCFHVGPFPDADLAARAETSLNGLQLLFARRAETSKTVSGYQVYLPPLSSKAAIERKLKQLTRLGFKDHAVIQEGELRDAISLGLFSVEANADVRVKKLAAKGIRAKVQALYQTRTLYWLDITTAVPADTAAKVKQIDWGAKDVQAQETACPAAARPPEARRDNAPD
jgi:hypothetical protein